MYNTKLVIKCHKNIAKKYFFCTKYIYPFKACNIKFNFYMIYSNNDRLMFVISYWSYKMLVYFSVLDFESSRGSMCRSFTTMMFNVIKYKNAKGLFYNWIILPCYYLKTFFINNVSM